MKTFWLLWTYIANHSDKPLEVRAPNAEAAVKSLTDFYSDDFAMKATIYVFDAPPVHVYKGLRA